MINLWRESSWLIYCVTEHRLTMGNYKPLCTYHGIITSGNILFPSPEFNSGQIRYQDQGFVLSFSGACFKSMESQYGGSVIKKQISRKQILSFLWDTFIIFSQSVLSFLQSHQPRAQTGHHQHVWTIPACTLEPNQKCLSLCPRRQKTLCLRNSRRKLESLQSGPQKADTVADKSLTTIQERLLAMPQTKQKK